MTSHWLLLLTGSCKYPGEWALATPFEWQINNKLQILFKMFYSHTSQLLCFWLNFEYALQSWHYLKGQSVWSSFVGSSWNPVFALWLFSCSFSVSQWSIAHHHQRPWWLHRSWHRRTFVSPWVESQWPRVGQPDGWPDRKKAIPSNFPRERIWEWEAHSRWH